MGSVTVRVAEETHRVLERLARSSGRSLQATLDDAVEAYRRRRLLEEAKAAFASLGADAMAWESEEAEGRQWDVTASDGLEEAE